MGVLCTAPLCTAAEEEETEGQSPQTCFVSNRCFFLLLSLPRDQARSLHTSDNTPNVQDPCPERPDPCL